MPADMRNNLDRVTDSLSFDLEEKISSSYDYCQQMRMMKYTGF